MKKLHSIQEYVKIINDDLPNDFFKPVATPLFRGIGYLTIVFLSIYLILNFNFNFGIDLLLSAILGFSFGSMTLLAHDILHGGVIKNRKLQDFLGTIGFFHFSISQRLWRRWHNTIHHGNTQIQSKDPDAWPALDELTKDSFLKKLYNLPYIVRVLGEICYLFLEFSIHSTRKFFEYKNDFNITEKRKLIVETITPWIFWSLLLFIIGLKNWLLIYLIPVMIANAIVMGYISTNHRLNPLVDVNDPLVNSLSLKIPKIFNYLHFNFSHHTEHHLFPRVSSTYYPLVKKIIKNKYKDTYNEMSHIKALLTLWKTPRIYFKKEYLINPKTQTVYNTLFKSYKAH